jgi:hypothetical protein
MRHKLAASSVAALGLVAGCGGSSGNMSLSEAFCSDLRKGLTPVQILGPAVRNGTYDARTAADRAYGFAANECPEQLQTNEGLRGYLEGMGINPDA